MAPSTCAVPMNLIEVVLKSVAQAIPQAASCSRLGASFVCATKSMSESTAELRWLTVQENETWLALLPVPELVPGPSTLN